MEFACKILSSPTVRRTLGATYPLVLVDEFQDCAAGTLSFVQALADASTVLIAADHFQKLQDVSDGCPAVEWAQAMWTSGDLVYEELLGCQRTDNTAILRAARALRDNVKSETATIPLYYAPNVGPAACRMIGRFGWGADKITTGSCALIVLSLDDPLLTKLLQSFANQAAKRKLKRKVSWSLAVPESEHHKVLCAELGLNDSGLVWHPKTTTTSHLAAVVARDLTRFCRLRGREDIPQDLAQQFARLAVHNFRAFGWNSQRFQVLTVHGAKNREFDHVFVFWTAFKARKWSTEEQRRLLYNAVTRAKLDCTILVLGDSKLMQEDPVISLLGPAQPAIDPAWKKRKKRPR